MILETAVESEPAAKHLSTNFHHRDTEITENFSVSLWYIVFVFLGSGSAGLG